MASSAPTIYLVRLSLDPPRALAGQSWYERADAGYLAHCQLTALFGDLAPKPFFLEQGRGRRVNVLGYTSASKGALRDHALAFADPAAASSCDLDGIDDKPMPAALWRAGRRVGFDVRVCPVHRKASDGPKHARGKEVDVFLSRCREAGPTVRVDREEVYRAWLAERLREGGAALVDVRMLRFRRTKLLRQTHGAKAREAKLVERPDAFLRGTLEIEDPQRFATLLARGIGRHRAFGFGMLLLRAPERPC